MGDFERFLQLAVQRALESMGETTADVVYYYAEKNHAIKREQIPQRLGDFSQALRRIFGPGGMVVEREIVRRLCDASGVYVEEDDFLKAVERVRRSLDVNESDTAARAGSSWSEGTGRRRAKVPAH